MGKFRELAHRARLSPTDRRNVHHGLYVKGDMKASDGTVLIPQKGIRGMQGPGPLNAKSVTAILNSEGYETVLSIGPNQAESDETEPTDDQVLEAVLDRPWLTKTVTFGPETPIAHEVGELALMAERPLDPKRVASAVLPKMNDSSAALEASRTEAA